MDQVIHINISATKTDTHHISSSFVRIWPHLLSTINWIFKNRIPGDNMLVQGIGMTVINNLAISVEGFISDIIFEYIEYNEELKKKYRVDIDRLTWFPKKDLYNQLFTKKLEDYIGYETIAVLMAFRNNLSHGRTYAESTARDFESGENSNLESDNANYQNVREYLIKNKLLKDTNVSSNVEIPWKIDAVCHFAGVVKFFLQNVLTENESKNKLGIETEFKLAYSI